MGKANRREQVLALQLNGHLARGKDFEKEVDAVGAVEVE